MVEQQPPRVRPGRPRTLDPQRGRRERLRRAVLASRARVEVRLRVGPPTPGGPGEPGPGPADAERLSAALAQLSRAEDSRSLEIGWALLNAADDLVTSTYTDDEVNAAIVVLRQQIDHGEISGWRQKAIADLLDHVTPPGAVPPPGDPVPGYGMPTRASDRVLLLQALRLRNNHYDLGHHTLRVSATRRVWLLIIGIVLLGVGAAVAWGDVRQPGDILVSGRVIGGVLVAGMLGAVTSAIQRLAVDPQTSVVLQLGSFTATVTRLFVGAVAALTVYLAHRGGILSFPGTHALPLLILASFGAGFAERLVVFHGKSA
ncbi:hypothetical protein GCM10010123_13370 [Pilimelia anulata]|uniref:Uncharacterized protein n=1 Tax=Pilimelia anulata TaxID=53371 RepID=A0A8J3F8B3_9ACTN|nr:hypothetical protein [Pilimelia anulata]GGJ85009.1 hypothetical protein GCM10010123_13370 [Pilimelia anulata]